jgi:hypothetical protein
MQRLLLIVVVVMALALGLVAGLARPSATAPHAPAPYAPAAAHLLVDGTSAPGVICGGSSSAWC